MKGGRVANLDPALLEYCYPQQAPVLQAAIDCGGSYTAAAKRLGMTSNAVECVVKRVRARAAKAGHAPDHDMTHPAAPGFHVKGVSTLYTADGQVAAQWVKTQASREQLLDSLREVIEDIAAPIRGAAKPAKKPRGGDADLCAIYPIGDSHFGMLAWGKETGQDFNLEIAERGIVTAIDALVDRAPHAKIGLVANMGDMTDNDNSSNMTPQSGNILDIDSRRPKILATTLRALRRTIDRALTIHERVHYFGVPGNHDPDTTWAITLALQMYYEREPRVMIHADQFWWYWFRHGACLFGFTHGDQCKPELVPGIMATDRAEDWGQTKHRHAYLGHLHSWILRDLPGCTVESVRATAPNNAWAYRKGYRSKQTLRCDIWHARDGLLDQYHEPIRFAA